ncbi:hypothetical protein D1007_62313 [Hordeum vulgare]|nr:hypothetical protein D1007_62313 [Hordeum vulgare]
MDGGSGGEEPCDDLDACSVDHNHRVRKKAAWIGDMHFGFGFKWAIVEHLYHYRGSQALGSHYDQVHSGAMMIVTEDVSSRSNRYDFDLHRKSARGTTTKETGVRLSIKTQRATIKIMSLTNKYR